MCQRIGKSDSTINLDLLAEPDRWHWHAYDYGWRRVMLDEKVDQSPIDRYKRWFEPRLANVAEGFWRRALNKPLPVKHPPATAEEIADTECLCNEARASLDAWARRNKRAFAAKRDIDPIKRVRDAMGVRVAEGSPSGPDPEAAERAAEWKRQLGVET
jgi:hypothetical protein